VSADPGGTPLVAEVAVAVPVRRTFSYAVPPELAGRLRRGHRVRVPLQGRARPGVVVGVGTPAPGAALAPIAALLDPVPALTPPLLELASWAADDSVSAWGEALARALPPAARVAAPTEVPADPAARPPGTLVVGYGPRRNGVIDATVARARAAGASVLLLAPEIETARTWAARLAEQSREPVTLLTSAETPRRRWEAWWRCRTGAVAIGVGTRVAAFAPLAGLGLAVVVDEHDPAHKAPDSPRWHARELAVRRSRIEGGDCLVVSGTPSLESWARLRAGEATAEEAKGDHWPMVQRVDLRTHGAGTALSPELRAGLRQCIAAGGRALLVLDRLGYGRALGCADCGAVRRCPHCRIALAYHRADRALACRLCGRRRPATSLCGRCRGRRLAPFGVGTESLEDEVRAALPGIPVGRYDGDVTAEQAADVRDAFRTGRLQVVVGTHMALRLLDETPVGLAALVLADTTLSLPDFRAGERTFQQAWQLAEGVVAGGSVWLQSYYPDHPALEAVALGTREAFYEREWAERVELGYPPARRMGRIVVEGREAAAAATGLADRCRTEGLTVLGPAALAGGRVQLVVLGASELPLALGRILEPLRGRRRLGAARLYIDVDPAELP
jgi:primosomal protein N' (replication factor Y) (superfamily II helicase)